MIRLGLVDFDTSHVIAFTQRINHLEVDPSEWVEGAQVVAGCPGESLMMPERIAGYAEQLSGYGVELVDRPEDLIGRVDAVMIESNQGSQHLKRARPFLEAGVTTWVDKPFAGDVAQADEMLALARKHGAKLMSSSSLRFDPTVQEALARREELGPILAADVWGNAPLHPGNPGLLHYGVHGVEILYALVGAGCRFVHSVNTAQGEIVTGQWKSGHVSAVRGLREGAYGFGFTAHYEKGHYSAVVEGAAFYREMLKAWIRYVETGEPPFDMAEAREIMAFMCAAEESNQSSGVRVSLAP